MSKPNYRAIFALITALCLLLLANLICLLTMDFWAQCEIPDFILMFILLAVTPAYGLLCYVFGQRDECIRKRNRADLENTYQLEPHGYRYLMRR